MQLSRLARIVTLVSVCAGSVSAFAGAPLKGVDVKLGRNPGNAAAMRTATTDADGRIDFGVLARGSYELLLPAAAQKQGGESAATDVVVIAINTGAKEPVQYEYSRKSASIVIHDRSTEARRTAPKKMLFDADGEHAVMVTIVKSKSNITNN
jgi:5-hydroxyisourate hydrolase-like protein (transthyretin family)